MVEIKLIVGLGNPGRKYEKTRHNVGFQTLDRLAEKWQTSWKNWKDLAKISVRRESRVILAKPQIYMNNSGEAVKELLDYHKMKLENLLVVVDDFSIPLGSLRLRKSGSAGGHNGLASIIEHAGSSDFSRLRIGIGPLDKGVDPVSFVLSEFLRPEVQQIDKMIDKSVETIDEIYRQGWEKAVSQLRQVSL